MATHHLPAPSGALGQIDKMAAQDGIAPSPAQQGDISHQCADLCKPASRQPLPKSLSPPTYYRARLRDIPPLRAQKIGELREILAAWPGLSPELRTACLAVTRLA